MNITLRCRGSKREQARPPICAAGRRAHRRAGCRGDQSNAALNARVRPNRQHSYRCRGSCSCRPQPSRRRTTSSRRQRFFLSVVGELGFHYNAVERALLVERGRRGRVEPCAQWSPPGQYRSPCPQRRVRCVVGKLARHRHWTSSRSRISAFGVGLAPGQQSRAPKSSQPPAFRVRARFDSGRDIVETGTAWCLPCYQGAGCFIFAS
jgi:hypothetical protein